MVPTKRTLISVNPNPEGVQGKVLLTFDDGTEIEASAVLAYDGTF